MPIRTRPEWEDWFHTLFSTLDTMGAATDSQVLAYDARAGADLGYGVLEFRQTLTVGPFTATFDCIATLIWKRSGGRWVESRWHCSMISKDVPPELLAAQS